VRVWCSDEITTIGTAEPIDTRGKRDPKLRSETNSVTLQ
jgi:hypothetical protein